MGRGPLAARSTAALGDLSGGCRVVGNGGERKTLSEEDDGNSGQAEVERLFQTKSHGNEKTSTARSKPLQRREHLQQQENLYGKERTSTATREPQQQLENLYVKERTSTVRREPQRQGEKVYGKE